VYATSNREKKIDGDGEIGVLLGKEEPEDDAAKHQPHTVANNGVDSMGREQPNLGDDPHLS
jgi:hypothetical protein